MRLYVDDQTKNKTKKNKKKKDIINGNKSTTTTLTINNVESTSSSSTACIVQQLISSSSPSPCCSENNNNEDDDNDDNSNNTNEINNINDNITSSDIIDTHTLIMMNRLLPLVQPQEQVLHNNDTSWNEYYRYVFTCDTLQHLVSTTSYYIGQHVWICKSKGKKKKKKSSVKQLDKVQRQEDDEDMLLSRYELFSRAKIVQIYNDGNSNNNKAHSSNYDSTIVHTAASTSTQSSNNGDICHVDKQQEQESESERSQQRMIQVQYPKGSTYHVRSNVIIPILDTTYIERYIFHTEYHHHQQQQQSKTVILVYPETNLYRRICCIHTLHNDHFIEIGCATGKTCYRIHTSTTDASTSTNINGTNNSNSNINNRIILGIDKSISCIQTAKQIHHSMKNNNSNNSNSINDNNNNYINQLHFVTYDLFQPSSLSVPSTSTTNSNSLDHPDDDTDDTTNSNNNSDNYKNNPTVQYILQCLMNGYTESCKITAKENENKDTDNVAATTDTMSMTGTTIDFEKLSIHHNKIITTDNDVNTTTTNNNNNSNTNNDKNNNQMIIAIDINGNRNLLPILQCIQIIYYSKLQPRLLIIKSRSLYQYIKKNQNCSTRPFM